MKFIGIILLFFSSLSLHAQGPQWIVYNTSNSGLPSNSITDIAIDTNGVKWIGTSDKGLIRFDGTNWTVYDTNNSGIHSNVAFTVKVDANNNIWVGSINSLPGGISKFTGTKWINYNPQNSGLPTSLVNGIDFDVFNNVWLATPLGLVKFNGSDWTIYNDSNSGIPSNRVFSLAIWDSIIWIGTQSHGVAKFDGVNWTIFNSQNSGLPFNAIRWNCISIDSNNIKWIGTFGGGLAKYDDLNWTVYDPNNSGLPYWYVQTVFSEQNNKIWAGVEGRGLTFFDNDTLWTTFNEKFSPLPNNSIRNLVSDKYANLWICTPSGIAIYNQNGIVNIKNNSNELPINFKLYQNYPNPFNPLTKISFDILFKTQVKLSIYNIEGRLIKKLINRELSTGNYEVFFDGTYLPSGVYLYKIETNIFSETKKMVLIK